MKIINVEQVAIWRLCSGCGACALACPEHNIQLVDIISEGIRPIVDHGRCRSCSECLKVCPGYESSHAVIDRTFELIRPLLEGWGPIMELYEGYAADSEIRYKGSSGGVATALALYCLENEEMEGVLHVAGDPVRPWKNRTVFSCNGRELIAATGSRYAPASPCDGIDRIMSARRPCVFIGKPCDIRGLRKTQSLKKEVNQKIGLAIGIFCAGTPSTRATLDLLECENRAVDQVAEIRYRGNGWPGKFTVSEKGKTDPSTVIPYQKAWGFLQAYRPFCCNLCPDSTSEFADISCGDPWYRTIQEDEIGSSLILVRTERGKAILHHAVEKGYIHIKLIEPRLLETSQKNLARKRMAIGGRLAAMKVVGLPIPQYRGFFIFQNWKRATFIDKLRSVMGTMKRIVARKYFRPMKWQFDNRHDP